MCTAVVVAIDGIGSPLTSTNIYPLFSLLSSVMCTGGMYSMSVAL